MPSEPVPAPGPPPGSVVLVTGVMAAGKSTVAQALAARLPKAVHVRGDTFRRMIVSGRAEPLPGEGSALSGEAAAQLRLRHRITAAVAVEYAAAGFTAIAQDVVLGDDLTHWTRLVRDRPLHVVVLAPDPAVVAAREAGRAKTGYGAWTVADLDRALRAGTPRVGLWLDTSAQTPEETVDAVLGRLAESRVGDGARPE
ncbi:AAA family ATPase [Streptomyces avicenniae]|uniref:AAA family ATPase n=1 Tax=Streptomyces avicenniae TaxID=500153 RepID=UPI00069CA7D6|nr:AAA family ATPase [Streptomyces avicenniae]